MRAHPPVQRRPRIGRRPAAGRAQQRLVAATCQTLQPALALQPRHERAGILARDPYRLGDIRHFNDRRSLGLKPREHPCLTRPQRTWSVQLDLHRAYGIA